MPVTVLSNANEQSTYVVPVTFTDPIAEAAVIPTSILWTLTDEMGNVINSRQSVSVDELASSIEIVLYGADLSLRDIYFGQSRALTVNAFYLDADDNELPLNQEFRFRVTNLVAIQYVALTTPTLTSPADGASLTDYTPTLSWGSVSGAENYLFQLSTSSVFASTVATQNSSATSFTPAAALTAGVTYYWRVRAQAAGLASDWSETRDFSIPTLSAPTIIGPATATPLNTYFPTFSWNSVVGAAGYELQVATDSGFTAIVDSYDNTATSYHTAVSYTASTTHYWRLRATGAGEIVSDWTLTRTFTLYVVYIHTVTGSNLNDGLSAGEAVLDIETAQTILTSLGGNGVIRIVAPAATPLGGGISAAYSFTAGKTVTLEALVAGTPWYITNSAQFTTGWTQVGATDVWTRTNSAGSGPWWVSTLPDVARDNLNTMVARAAVIDTHTPAALEYAIDGSTTYINLGTGINPNSHTVHRPRVARVMDIVSGATVYLRDCEMKYSTTDTLLINDGIFYAEDSDFLYGGNCGLGTSTNATLTDMTRCRAIRAAGNDGFNHNFGIMNLTDCEASWNSDEGASPHADSTMNVFGGTYSHNDSPGFTAANNAIMNLFGVIVEYNLVDPSPGEDTFGGITYGSNSSGVCEDCISRNNFSAGFYCQTTGSVTVNNLTSGIAQGNAEADVLC